ncbi:MAG: AAA family ATPase [Actinomycetota bacterium]|nr:AAA family ATPase [Actinomycetota bacterium]
MKTSFLDHSTATNRLADIDAELALNRRLAPDVYLGTADVTEGDAVVDRMLVMRRLPADRRLTALVNSPELHDQLRAVARAVAVFHAGLEPLRYTVTGGRSVAEIAGRDAVWQNWKDNFVDLEPLVGRLIPFEDAQEVEHSVDQFLGHHSAMFEDRIAAGFVRDGHGDLTAEDIFCLPDGPRILDCLAFSPELRIGDVLLDVAFLAMDLDRLCGPGLAAEFMGYYREFTNEHHASSLAHHYVAYRAHVRAKVAGLRALHGDESQATLTRVYHDLCLQHLRRANLTLILVGGTPGTGKTTLAEGLSGVLGSMLLSTDELRKDLTGVDHLDRRFVETDTGIYDRSATEKTYTELLRRAGTLLDRGESVVLDASWSQAALREQARRLAADKGADVVEFECVLDAAEAKNRIERRLEQGTDPSDARPELLDELRARFHPWPTAARIDSSAPRSAMVEATLVHLHRVLIRLGEGSPPDAQPADRRTAGQPTSG